MPIYEYECPKCEKVHEKMQKFSDPPLANCPDCNGPVEKIMSLSSFSLKGGGWYSQGYDGKSNQSASQSSGSGSKSTGSSDSSGSSSASSKSSAKSSEGSPSKKSESKPKSNPESKAT